MAEKCDRWIGARYPRHDTTFAIQISFFVGLLNMIAKMLNSFFGELYLIVNVNSKMLNLAASVLREKKMIFAFNVYVDNIV